MNGDPRNIHAYARAMLVEQVMALHGRGSSDPKTYRRILQRMDIPALRRAIEESDFPALSLTETAGVIASTDKGHAPDSSRESSFNSADERPQFMPTAGESPAPTEAQMPAGVGKTNPSIRPSDLCASAPLILQSSLP